MLEDEFFGSLKFSRRELELFINDRALAPNTAETLAACEPDLASFLKKLAGSDEFQIQHDTEPRRRFGVTVKFSKPFDFGAIG